VGEEESGGAALSFEDYARMLIESERAGWSSAKHARQWASTLAQYAFPVIGHKRPDEITTADVLAVLRPLWTEKTRTATRLRQRIEAVLDCAFALEHIERVNPARWRGRLDKLLPPPGKLRHVRHFAAAPYAAVPRIMAELRRRPFMSAHALRFLIPPPAAAARCAGRAGRRST
jgi:hypothetical protein